MDWVDYRILPNPYIPRPASHQQDQNYLFFPKSTKCLVDKEREATPMVGDLIGGIITLVVALTKMKIG
jgi:hypothetical protein